MFDEMTASIREGTVRIMLTVPVRSEEDVRREQQAKITSTSGASDGSDKARPVRKDKKPGPNDPCYCGSGKKYKKCHMQADQAEAAKAAAQTAEGKRTLRFAAADKWNMEKPIQVVIPSV